MFSIDTYIKGDIYSNKLWPNTSSCIPYFLCLYMCLSVCHLVVEGSCQHHHFRQATQDSSGDMLILLLA